MSARGDALGDDPRLVHDHEPVAQLLRLVHVVGRQDERHAALLESVEAIPEQVARLRVEAGRRLVEEQQLGLVDERAGDRQAALHPARHVLDLVARPLRELGEVEQLVGAAGAFRAAEAEVPAVDHEVLADRELVVERVLLGHDAEARPDLRTVPFGVQAQDGQRAVADRRDARDHPHRGGLAGAVGAQEAERFAGRDVEVDGVHGGELAEPLGQSAGMDERGGRRGAGGGHRRRHGRVGHGRAWYRGRVRVVGTPQCSRDEP